MTLGFCPSKFNLSNPSQNGFWSVGRTDGYHFGYPFFLGLRQSRNWKPESGMLVFCPFSAPLVFLAPNCWQWIMWDRKKFQGTVSIPDRSLISANKIKWSRHLFVPTTNKLIAVQCASGCILKLLNFYGSGLQHVCSMHPTSHLLFSAFSFLFFIFLVEF